MDYNKIFKQINKIIPNHIFKNKLEIVLNIFFTAVNIRPACIPFDSEIKYKGMTGNDMIKFMKESKKGQKILKDLEEIPNIKIKYGDYHDTGDVYVIYNKNQEDFLNPIFKKIKKIHTQKETVNNKIKLHDLIGQMLGYICTKDFGKLKYKDEIYIAKFIINNQTEHLGIYCLKNNKKELLKYLNKLTEITDILQQIDKKFKVDLIIKTGKYAYKA